MSIHNLSTRLFISVFVLLIILLLVVPHLMDVHPPLIIKILMKPVEWLAALVGRLLPHPNIGTPENPVHEGTPIDLIVGLALVFFCVFLYPVVTFFALSLLSRILKRRAYTQNS